MSSSDLCRFKQNCLKATEGFNHVLLHFNERQHYLSEVHKRTWQQIKSRGETAVKKVTQVSASTTTTTTMKIPQDEPRASWSYIWTSSRSD